MDGPTALVESSPVDEEALPWVSLVDPAASPCARPEPPTVGRVVRRFVVANIVGILLLMAGSVWASRQEARAEAIADARATTDVIAGLLVQPNLEESLLTGDAKAVARMNAAVRGRLSNAGIIRVKIWAPDGLIVYSDEPRLIGSRFPLDDEDLAVLKDGVNRADVSDLSRPENRYERSFGRLLQVYRQIHSPAGKPMLLETYSSYDQATARQMDIWLMFAPITAAVLLAMLLMQLPLARRMVVQLRSSQRERELLQARALDTSTEERRRIAGSLHDGIVQDVSASSLLVARAADRLRCPQPHGAREEVADVLREASAALRESVGSLRSLLVEIYPPTLERAGLDSALADLAARLRPRGIDVRVQVPATVDIPPETATLFFRTAQEALLNVAKHARASAVEVVVRDLPDRLTLQVTDDGVGFDLPSVRNRPQREHFGLNVLSDLAAADGAHLAVRTARGAGTSLLLEVPRS